jgi:hypothetical protein
MINTFFFLILNIGTFRAMAGFEISGNTETGNPQELIECRIYRIFIPRNAVLHLLARENFHVPEKFLDTINKMLIFG